MSDLSELFPHLADYAQTVPSPLPIEEAIVLDKVRDAREKGSYIVNLYGGPGTGKSTTAAALFAELKQRGEKAELVTEVAKEYSYAGEGRRLEDQLFILAEQARRQRISQGQARFIITDSPLPIGLLYTSGPYDQPWFRDTVLHMFSTFNNLNVLLNRVKKFEDYGRHHSEEQSRLIDARLRSEFRNEINYHKEQDADVNAARHLADWLQAGMYY